MKTKNRVAIPPPPKKVFAAKICDAVQVGRRAFDLTNATPTPYPIDSTEDPAPNSINRRLRTNGIDLSRFGLTWEARADVGAEFK